MLWVINPYVGVMQAQLRHNGEASSSGIGPPGPNNGAVRLGTAGPNKSRYRGVSYDKKKRKWRVQIKVRDPAWLPY